MYKYIFYLILYSYNIYSQTEVDKVVKSVEFERVALIQKNDTIVYLHSEIKNPKQKKPTIIFVQGSKSLPLLFQDSTAIGSIIPFDIKPYTDKFNFVIIARKGIPLVGKYGQDENGYVDKNGHVPKQFKKYDNINYRTLQLKYVIKDLRKKKWVDNKNLILIGHSEGYRVAAKFADKDKYIGKFVFMSADPFNRVTQEITKYRLECFFSNNDEGIQNIIDNIVTDYDSLLSLQSSKSEDFDFQNWISYNSGFTYNYLKSIKKPSLIIYGTDDIVAFNNDLLHLLLDKNFFKIIALPDLDHNFFKQNYDSSGMPTEKTYHWDEVFNLVVNWLQEGRD